MEQPYDIRDLIKKETSKEKALALGERLGTLVAAEVVAQPVRRVVAQLIKAGEDLKDHELYDLLYSSFIQTFQLLLATDTKGMEARSAVSADYLRHAADARRDASRVSIAAAADGDMSQAPEVEHLLMSCSEAINAANKLFSPVNENLMQLVNSAKVTEVMKQRRRELMEAGGGHECGNPDCTCHTNH